MKPRSLASTLEHHAAIIESIYHHVITPVLTTQSHIWSETLIEVLNSHTDKYKNYDFYPYLRNLINYVVEIQSLTKKEFGDKVLTKEIIERNKNIYRTSVLSFINGIKERASTLTAGDSFNSGSPRLFIAKKNDESSAPLIEQPKENAGQSVVMYKK